MPGAADRMFQPETGFPDRSFQDWVVSRVVWDAHIKGKEENPRCQSAGWEHWGSA